LAHTTYGKQECLQFVSTKIAIAQCIENAVSTVSGSSESDHGIVLSTCVLASFFAGVGGFTNEDEMTILVVGVLIGVLLTIQYSMLCCQFNVSTDTLVVTGTSKTDVWFPFSGNSTLGLLLNKLCFLSV
jgi:hypothetical protein